MKLSDIIDEEPPIIHKSALMPKDFLRIIVVGESGSGKTVCLPELICNYFGNVDHIILFCEHYKQKPYQYLYDTGVKMDINKEWNSDFWAESYTGDDRHCVVIIDDQPMDPRVLSAFNFLFTRGRHMKCSVVLLTQDFFSVPKIARKNTNTFFFFRVNNFTHISREVCGSDETKDITKMYKDATKEPYSFFSIWNHPRLPSHLRYRRKFAEIDEKKMPIVSF